MRGATTWIVIAHGSRAPQVTDDHQRVCDELSDLAGDDVAVRPAYLEINEPSIPAAIDAAVEAGARSLVLVPYFLHAGNHTSRDIPAQIEAARARHAGVVFSLARHLGPDARLVEILADRAAESRGAPGSAAGDPTK